MVETVFGIIATLVCGFGYGTIYFFTSLFWTVILTYLGNKLGFYNMVIKYDKSTQEEKT